jgi:hypothetical protein
MTTVADLVAVPPYVSVGCPYCGQAPGWACCNARMEVPGTRETTVPTHAERKKAYEHAGPPGVAKFVQLVLVDGDRLALDANGGVWRFSQKIGKPGVYGWYPESTERFEEE